MLKNWMSLKSECRKTRSLLVKLGYMNINRSRIRSSAEITCVMTYLKCRSRLAVL